MIDEIVRELKQRGVHHWHNSLIEDWAKRTPNFEVRKALRHIAKKKNEELKFRNALARRGLVQLDLFD